MASSEGKRNGSETSDNPAYHIAYPIGRNNLQKVRESTVRTAHRSLPTLPKGIQKSTPFSIFRGGARGRNHFFPHLDRHVVTSYSLYTLITFLALGENEDTLIRTFLSLHHCVPTRLVVHAHRLVYNFLYETRIAAPGRSSTSCGTGDDPRTYCDDLSLMFLRAKRWHLLRCTRSLIRCPPPPRAPLLHSLSSNWKQRIFTCRRNPKLMVKF